MMLVFGAGHCNCDLNSGVISLVKCLLYPEIVLTPVLLSRFKGLNVH